MLTSLAIYRNSEIEMSNAEVGEIKGLLDACRDRCQTLYAFHLSMLPPTAWNHPAPEPLFKNVI